VNPSIRRRRGMVAAVACAASLAGAAPASADFAPPYDQQCSGGPLTAAGTSVGDLFWQFGIVEFRTGNAPESCPASPIPITYTASSSGTGLAAFRGLDGSRDPSIRLAGTAEAPGPVELALIEEGDPETSADDAQLRTIPEHAAAIAVIVNFPDGCTIPAENALGSGTTERFQVPNASLEAAYAGDPSADTWGEVLPGIGGEGCAAKPVQRVVRAERSGATFALKRWLDTVNGERSWDVLARPFRNTSWPNEDVNLVRAADTSPSGNVDEANAVTAGDGSIGYVDLAAARARGFSEAGAANDDRYWIPVHNGAGTLTEPTRVAASITTNARGANCETATFTGVPTGADPTLASWRGVSAAGSPTGYPVCTLGYALAWDDASDAYGTAEAEQATQRTVRDLLGFQLGTTGQSFARVSDQAPLQTAILTAARSGQQQVGWDKP
jgi:ABC-type phosphate transport system substrate-binding protein